MARRLEPTVFLAAISPVTVGLAAGTVVLVRTFGAAWWRAIASGGLVWVGRAGLAALIARRVQLEIGITSVWEVARRSQTLTDARRSIDINELDRALDSIPADDPRHRSARAQRDSHDRLAAGEEETRERLEVLDAQLDEAGARVAELAIRAGGTEDTVEKVAAQVAMVVTELDTLRIALDELRVDP